MLPTKAGIQRLRSPSGEKTPRGPRALCRRGRESRGRVAGGKFPFEEIYATAGWTGARTQEISADEMGSALKAPLPHPATVLAVGKISREPLGGAGALGTGRIYPRARRRAGRWATSASLLRIADWFAFDRVLFSPGLRGFTSPEGHQRQHGLVRPRANAHRRSRPGPSRPRLTPVLSCRTDRRGCPRYCRRWWTSVAVIGSEGRGRPPAVAARVTRHVTTATGTRRVAQRGGRRRDRLRQSSPRSQLRFIFLLAAGTLLAAPAAMQGCSARDVGS